MLSMTTVTDMNKVILAASLSLVAAAAQANDILISKETGSYTLVMTAASNGLGTKGLAIDHLPGFASKAECDEAGKQWRTDIEVRFKGIFGGTSCVKQSKPQS